MLIGIADSGVDDDRLAPRQPPLLQLAAGGAEQPHDPLGHGTAVASILVANRPDVGRRRPRARTRRCCRRASSGRRSCSEAVLEHGLVAAFGWLRTAGRAGRQRLGDGAPLARARRLAARAAALGRAGRRRRRQRRRTRRARRSRPRSPACSASARSRPARRRRSGRDRRAARRSISSLRRRASGCVASSAPAESAPRPHHPGGHVVRGAARDRRGGDGLGDPPRLDGRRGRATRSCAAPRRSAGGAPSRNWGYGRLNVSPRTAHAADCPTRTSRTTGSPPRSLPAAAAPRRGGRREPRLGRATRVDAYTVDVPPAATARAVLRQGGPALTMRVLPIGASDAALDAVRPPRAGLPSQVAVPRRAARSLVVAPQPGAGAPTRSRSRATGSSAAEAVCGATPASGRAPARRPPGDGAADQHDVAHQVEPHEQHGRAAERLQRGEPLDRAHVERQRLERELQERRSRSARRAAPAGW